MFNENLKNIRLKQGLSQKKVADYLDISPQSVSKWEKGESLPSVLFLPQLAECLDCEINDFFKQEEKKYNLKSLEQYFLIINELADSELKDYDKVVMLFEENPSFETVFKAMGEEVKKHKLIKNKTLQSILGCSEDEAAKFINYFLDFEWIELLDSDEYYVLKSNVDGTMILLHTLVQLNECLKANK